MPRVAIAVNGAGTCDAVVGKIAYDIGYGVAKRGAVLITGGLTGVMQAASSGAHDAGGLVVGILPGLDPASANSAVDVAIPTGMGQLRNGLVVSSGHAVIAVEGEWGTLSEIAFALKLGKPVVAWNGWQLARKGNWDETIVRVTSPEEAVEQAFNLASRGALTA